MADLLKPLPSPDDKPYGQRLINDALDDWAREKPNQVAYAIPRTRDPADGYEDITVSRLANAVDRTARWMEKTLGKSNTNEVYAYMGITDLRYSLFIFAAPKVGRATLLLSTRNSDEAQYSLMAKTNVKRFLCPASEEKRYRTLIANWQDAPSDFEIVVVPEQDELLDPTPVEPYPLAKTFEEMKSETFVLVHTSGTTGLPKPLRMSFAYAAFEDILHKIPDWDGKKVLTAIGSKPDYHQKRLMCPMPSFHAGGIFCMIMKVAYTRNCVIILPPYVPITGDLCHDVTTYAKADWILLPPALLEQWIADPTKLETLKKIDYCFFGSGPTSRAVGDLAFQVQPGMCHGMGMSETGMNLSMMTQDWRDWQYFDFHPWMGATWEDIGSDGLHELVIKRITVPGLPHLQPCFEMFPDLEEFHTKDLFSQHPTKPNLWKFEGRADDVIVFNTGEKMNPVTAEGKLIGAHPRISGALIVGQERFQGGLVLEVSKPHLETDDERNKFLEEIWPHIERANQELPAYGRIIPQLVTFLPPGKFFARTPKLSMQRRPTLKLFAKEIDEMYARAEQSGVGGIKDHLIEIEDIHSIQSVQNATKEAVDKTGGSLAKVGIKEDFFENGLDSQGALHLVRTLNNMLKASVKDGQAPHLTPRTVYENGSIERLSGAIYKILNPQTVSNGEPVSLEARAQAILDKYVKLLPKAPQTNSHTNGTSKSSGSVILTGSTGGLGTYLLASLLQDSKYIKIYCVNRSEIAQTRQYAAFEAQGMSSDILKDAEKRGTVEFLFSNDLSAEHLGLPAATYDKLQAETIAVIHNAWPVNFNLPLESFDSHVGGVKRFIDLCAASPRHPQLCFISSVSSAAAYPSMPIPEQFLTDFNNSIPSGYGKSKQISELLLKHASEVSGVSTIALRLGQIAGPALSSIDGGKDGKPGVWNEKEWFPRLMISSKTIGALPASIQSMDVVDWVPIDVITQASLDLLDGGDGARVFNILNPASVSYVKEVLPVISKRLGPGVQIVPLADWVAKVQAAGPVEANPAIKLGDFFEGMAAEQNPAIGGRFSTEKAQAASESLRSIGPVTAAMIERWMAGWGM